MITKDFYTRLLSLDDAAGLLSYYLENREFHAPWSPVYPENFYTLEFQHRRLANYLQINEREHEYRFAISSVTSPMDILGIINLTNVERGAFHNGRLGYSIAESIGGKGVMTAMLTEVTEFVFNYLYLHRLEANIMPRNIASRRVLEKCGFTCIGQSPKYLLINGIWEDHSHYAMLRDDFAARQSAPK